MKKIPRDFQLQLHRINTPSQTTTPLPPLLQSHLIYFICCYILVFSCYIFVNFWAAIALAYFLCQTNSETNLSKGTSETSMKENLRRRS